MTVDHHPHLIIVASGAGRIPFSLTKIIVDVVKHDKSIDEAIQARRFFAADETFYSERRLSHEEKKVVSERGYDYVYEPEQMFYGGVQAIHVRDQTVTGAADWRRGGTFQCNTI